MSKEETKPILHDSGKLYYKSRTLFESFILSVIIIILIIIIAVMTYATSGVHTKSSGSQPHQSLQQQQQQQHLIIQPIEFDYKHRNYYGYLALATFILTLINYIMIKERSCQISLANGLQSYDLIQGFHMTTMIITIIVFVLSYFNFALVIQEFKILFYTSAALILACSGLLIYNAIAIVSAPCTSIDNPFANPFLQLFDTSFFNQDANNIFTAGDGVGITVFLFDLVGTVLMIFAARNFYQRN